jgi:hypothetical protein
MKKIIYIYQGNETEMTWSEANEEIARAEAENGEIEITPDDGKPEPVVPMTDAPTWDELAAALQKGVDAV